MQILNVGASSSSSTQLDHIPQFIGVNLGAAGTIARLTVTSLKRGVLLDLSSEAQVNAIWQSLSYKTVAASEVCLIPIAAGYTENEDININVVTGAGNAITIHDISLVGNPARIVYVTNVVGITANAQAAFEKFSKMIPISPNAADVITITSADTENSNTLTVAELQSITSTQSNNTTVVVIRNNDQTVKRVQYAPTAAREIVVVKIAVNGTTNMNEMVQEINTNLQKKIGTGAAAAPALVTAAKALETVKKINK